MSATYHLASTHSAVEPLYLMYNSPCDSTISTPLAEATSDLAILDPLTPSLTFTPTPRPVVGKHFETRPTIF